MNAFRVNEGSIPAGAGETGLFEIRISQPRVYPRGCGGNSAWIVKQGPITGISPRVRGKHYRRAVC